MTGLGLSGAIASAVAARGELRAGRASAAVHHLCAARQRFGFCVGMLGESEAARMLRDELIRLELDATRAIETLEEKRQ